MSLCKVNNSQQNLRAKLSQISLALQIQSRTKENQRHRSFSRDPWACLVARHHSWDRIDYLSASARIKAQVGSSASASSSSSQVSHQCDWSVKIHKVAMGHFLMIVKMQDWTQPCCFVVCRTLGAHSVFDGRQVDRRTWPNWPLQHKW